MLETTALALLTFTAAFINDALGGGYGTITGSVLLLFAYPPQSFVPAILFSEAISEYWSGAWHVRYHNVNSRTFLLTTLGGIIGIVTAILLVGAFLSGDLARLYIGLMAVLMGAFVIFKSHRQSALRARQNHATDLWKTVILGFICGFNKSGSGGGYGPISTTGYMLLGLPPAIAVGTTILAKATNCLLSIILWAALRGGIDWRLTIRMSVGAFLGAPIAAWLNNYLKVNIRPLHHERLIGFIMMLLGTFSLLKQFGLL